MAEVELVLPDGGRAVDPAALLADLREAQHALYPFAPPVIDFVADLARRLRRDTGLRRDPSVAALAYWIRPANITRLAQDWERVAGLHDDVIRVPRGTAFHIPPTNVDTLFVYSWLLSALAGNANVVRISPSALETPSPLLALIDEALAAHPIVATSTAMVTYDRDRAVTASLSEADVRVIWGGDDTVAAIRAVPLARHAFELAFPDRYSLALFDAAAVAGLDEVEADALAQRFFNDAYWFDQLGCASPRVIVWRGGPHDARRASGRLRRALRRELDRRDLDPVPTSAVIAKLVHAADTAATTAVSEVEWSAGDLTLVGLRDLGALRRDSPGGGLFYEARVAQLDELVPVVRRRDQTVSHFGLDIGELRRFVVAVGSRGVDRIVPVGEALSFDRFWDGHDLLVAFTRGVTVRP